MPVHVGDVFLIPVDEDRQAVGQIVARYRLTELYCLVVFDDIVRSGEAPPSMEPRSDRAIIFVASTFDAMLEDGWWRTLGNSAPCAVQLPAYKILQEVYTNEEVEASKFLGNQYYESYKERVLRSKDVRLVLQLLQRYVKMVFEKKYDVKLI